MFWVDHRAPIPQGELWINCWLARNHRLPSVQPIIPWKITLWLCTYPTHINESCICSSSPCIFLPCSRAEWIIWLRTCTTVLNEGRWFSPVRPRSWSHSCQGCPRILFYLHSHSLHHSWGCPGSWFRHSKQRWLLCFQLSRWWHVPTSQGYGKL